MLPIKCEAFTLAEKWKILLLVFIQMLLNFPANGEFVLPLTNVWKIKILICEFFRCYLYLVLHRNCTMWIFLKLSSITAPDFFHTFTVHFELAPVVLHPRQNGADNLEMVYYYKINKVTQIWYVASYLHKSIRDSVPFNVTQRSSFMGYSCASDQYLFTFPVCNLCHD